MSTPEAGPSSTPQKRSLNRQEILEEDEYTAALSHIIARDFFPSLVHLDATNGYLDALRSNDPSLIQASVRRLQEVDSTPAYSARRDWQTPSETPYGVGPSDTPFHIPREVGEPAAKRPRYDTSMSLDSFQAKYTSEDNASFTQIMHEENRQRQERWAWAWEAQRRVEEQRGKMLEGRRRMLIEQPPGPGVRERVVIEAPTVAALIMAAGESSGLHNTVTHSEIDPERRELAVVEKHASEQVVDVMAPKRDTRFAGVDAWKFKTRNSLMFPPDADVSPYDLPTSTVSVKADVVPRVVKHDNTRLLEQDTAGKRQSLSVPPSPTQSRIDAAIEGTPYRPKSPTAGNFSLVPNVPSPTADQMGSKAVKQLMTWGTLNATPRVISQSDDVPEEMPPPNTFQISAPSSREALSHKLSASAAKSLRAKAGLLVGSTPLLGRTAYRTPARGPMAPPHWTPRRADAPGNLTPAAKRLLDRTTLGTAASRRADAMGKISSWGSNGSSKEKDLNHVRWTPTPVTRRG
ncbi:nuclear protein DGCR14 [Butyriboletus roseoflavus]|nr:nuclear protein DGCR14 [Butyriboletus roseoflavus]